MLIIDGRFNGPPGSGNGGYSAGSVAAQLPPGDGVPEVTLRSPPPLERELSVSPVEGGIAVHGGDVLVAEARRVTVLLDSPAAIDFVAATAAAEHYIGLHDHPYPTCFVCGPDRVAGDGLRIFSGAVDGSRIVAAPWIPDPSVADDDGLVRAEVVWAALDCPSWFGYAAFETWEGRPLLGRLAAEILARPSAGERLVSIGWPISRDGRKIHSGAALFTADGTLIARSRATWLLVP